MSEAIPLGIAAAREGWTYSDLYKLVKRRPDLPGLIKVGRHTAVDAAKLPELRKAIEDGSLIKNARVAVA